MRPVSSIKTTKALGAAIAAAAMLLPSTRAAFAEAAPERGIVAFKYLNYQDSQPHQDRMDINAYSVRAMTPIAGKWAIDVTGTYDSVSGASPHYHTYFDTSSGASKLNKDERKAVDLNVTRYFHSGSITAGTSYSTESDYISRSISLQGSYSTPSKNTTFTAGGSYTSDSIEPNNDIFDYTEHKRTYSGLLGITQVMSKNDIVQFNIGRSLGTGYFSDPYKTYDERPRHRNSSTFLARWNHFFESSQGATRLSYRYYTDTFGIEAHSLSAEIVRPLPHDFTVSPSLRLYTQTAADFYIPVGAAEKANPDIATDPYPAVVYSEDQRLSAFGAVTMGLKVSKKFGQDWLVDVRYDHYMQRGDWAVSGKRDPGLADFNADFIQIGVSKEF